MPATSREPRLFARIGVGAEPCLHPPKPRDSRVPTFLLDLGPHGPNAVVKSALHGAKLAHGLDERIHDAASAFVNATS